MSSLTIVSGIIALLCVSFAIYVHFSTKDKNIKHSH